MCHTGLPSPDGCQSSHSQVATRLGIKVEIFFHSLKKKSPAYADGCTQATEHWGTLPCVLLPLSLPDSAVLGVSHSGAKGLLAPDTQGQMWGAVSTGHAAGDKAQQEGSHSALAEAPDFL